MTKKTIKREINCLVCKKLFIQKSKRSKFCSWKCYYQYYVETNKEKEKLRYRNYQIKNREKINKKIAEWRNNNKKYKEYQKNYERINRDKIRNRKIAYQIKNREKILKKINERINRIKETIKYKEYTRRNAKNYKLRYPEKIKATKKARAIKIPEGKKCEICNINLATQKHHEDYSKPLEVKFLCRKCHMILHRRLK